MNKFTTAVRAFVDDENGVTALEYGLIAALIAAGLVTATTTMGTNIKAAFNWIASKIPGTYT